MIEVEGLTVRFGGVTPLDGMTVAFPGRHCGLIGPNGAGKTTFFNVLSGFVKPRTGTVRAFGEDLLRMADFRRARWGLRRTFQTEQAIAKLSVFENVAMIHEHSGGGRATRRDDVMEALASSGSRSWRRRRSARWGRGAAGGRARAGGRGQAASRAARRARRRPPGGADRRLGEMIKAIPDHSAPS